jgi:hypothetical protein
VSVGEGVAVKPVVCSVAVKVIVSGVFVTEMNRCVGMDVGLVISVPQDVVTTKIIITTARV